MRKRRKGFKLNNDVEPELSVDDILAEFNFDQAGEESDYDTGWAEPAWEDDEDVKVYGQAADSYASQDVFDFVPDYEPDSPYDYTPMMDSASPYDYEPDYISADEYSYPDEYRYQNSAESYTSRSRGGAIGAMEDEARSILAQIQAEAKDELDNPDFDFLRYINDLPYMNQSEEPEYEDAEEYTGEYEDNYDEGDYAEALEQSPGYYEQPEEYYDESGNYEYALDMGYDPDPSSYSREDINSVFSSRGMDDIEIDSRFNLSGKKQRRSMEYGGEALDLSADEDYAPTVQSGYAPTQWTPDYDDPVTNTGEVEEPQRKKHKFIFGKKKKQKEEPLSESYDPYGGTAPADGERVQSFKDSDADDAEYAQYDEYGDEKRYEESEMYFPPSFREYVLSIFASVFLRMRGSVRGDTVGTMEDEEEDLGPELTPLAASKYYGSFIKSLKLRLRISAVLLLILCYISLELPIPGMLRFLPVASAFCFALQSAIMLLALDVVTNAVLNIFRMKIGADSLAVLACLVTGADAMIVALSESAALHMPLCAISSASLVGLLLAAFLNARGMRKSLRVPAIGKRFYAVTGELKLKAKELTLLKSLRSYNGFVRRSEEAAPDETAFIKLGLPMLLLSLLLAVIVAAVKKSYSDFIYIYSAIVCAAVPFTALVAYTLPFFLGSTRIFRSGAAIAGWSGLCDIGSSRNIIVTDRDIFPESAIITESVRIFADEDAQKVISYAGSMMQASGACSAACFLELMEENDCEMKQVDGFEFLPGGGMKGVIEGHKVLCGSTELMRLMNVRIPFRLTDKTTVLLAIDGILYGIFSLHYEPLPQVRRALVELVRSSRHPVFAVRDFNINPEMLHNTFDISTDGYDFPPYAERLELSTPTDDGKTRNIAAVICNEGLGPLTSVADVGRRMYMSVRANVLINVISAVLGMFFVFVRLITVGSMSLGTLLVFMLAACVPVVLSSLYVNIKN